MAGVAPAVSELLRMSLPAGHPRLSKRPYSLGELVADGVVHGAAILAAVVGLAALILMVALSGDGISLAATIVYAGCLLAMLCFSAAYNMTPTSPLKWLFRRFDHVGIYLAIAGTYTPLITRFADDFWAWTLGITVWAGAAAGSILKLALPGRFEKLSIAAYLALGWVAVFAIKPMFESLPLAASVLVLVGGLLYSVGVVFYRWHNLKYQNAIWHGFVVVAAGCHFAAVAITMAPAAIG
jgi:hemolysin III